MARGKNIVSATTPMDSISEKERADQSMAPGTQEDHWVCHGRLRSFNKRTGVYCTLPLLTDLQFT